MVQQLYQRYQVQQFLSEISKQSIINQTRPLTSGCGSAVLSEISKQSIINQARPLTSGCCLAVLSEISGSAVFIRDI